MTKTVILPSLFEKIVLPNGFISTSVLRKPYKTAKGKAERKESLS